MKKRILKGFMLILCAISICFMLYGCNESDVMRLDTRLTIDGSFLGQRVITVRFPDSITKSDASIEKLENIISKNCPKDLSYERLEGDDVMYAFTLDFSSKTDYEDKIKSVIGHDAIVSFGTYDNILTKGWSLYEDFSTLDTMKWLSDAVEESSEKKLSFTFDNSNKPVVTVSGTTGTVNSTSGNIYASDLTGHAVHSVEIQTTNYKDKNYDRKIILTFPEETHQKLNKELESYISELAGATTAESWTKSGNYHVFEAFYENIDYTTLGNVTSALLNCTDESVIYGDINNSSTPLAEQLVFEEKLNLLSFIPEKGRTVDLTYSYTLPSITSIGDGLIMQSGAWQKSGGWSDGKYTLQSKSPSLAIRIPDGIQYSVQGIDIVLSHNSENEFKRTVSFVYDNENSAGYNYACGFFGDVGAEIVQSVPDGKKLICSVVFEGTSQQISEQLGKIFGGGNYISSNSKSSITSVVTKLDFVDSMNIEYMLSANNADAPITYTFIKSAGEHITDIRVNESGTESEIKAEKDSSEIKMRLKSGNASISGKSTLPYQDGIVFCSIFFSLLVVLAVVLVLLNINSARKYTEKLMKLRKRDN